jgi:hypothetical protein
MAEHFRIYDDDIPIILGASATTGEAPKLCRLRDLWKYPSIYRHVPRKELLAFAQAFASNMEAVDALITTDTVPPLDLYQETQQRAQRHLQQWESKLTGGQELPYPIMYAAGVEFSDGSRRFAAHTQAIEYPCSVEAVSKIAAFIEVAGENDIQPLWLVVVDQFGICHAPFAPGRAYLSENNFAKTLRTHVHDDMGALHAGILFDSVYNPQSGLISWKKTILSAERV